MNDSYERGGRGIIFGEMMNNPDTKMSLHCTPGCVLTEFIFFHCGKQRKHIRSVFQWKTLKLIKNVTSWILFS